jgi:hypothetical protein
MSPGPGDRGNLGGNGSHSILVPVERPEDIAFVIMPFADAFKPLLNIIESAALKVGLRAIRTDTRPEGPDFVQEIVRHIREARMIVAVCTPEGGKSKTPKPDPTHTNHVPNPNVMYELGMSHGIGKGVVILSTDPARLPTDLKTKIAVKYDPDKLDDRLVLEIAAAMTRVKEQVQNGITDQSHRDIRVVPGLPLSWKDILYVLRFSKTVHKEFQALTFFHLDGLAKQGLQLEQRMLEDHQSNQLPYMREMFVEKWDQYERSLADVLDLIGSTFLSQPAATKLEETLAAIINSSPGTMASQAQKCGQFCSVVRRKLSEFKTLHDEALAVVQNNLASSIYNPTMLSQFNLRLGKIAREARSLLVQADMLIFNLIILMESIDG